MTRRLKFRSTIKKKKKKHINKNKNKTKKHDNEWYRAQFTADLHQI